MFLYSWLLLDFRPSQDLLDIMIIVAEYIQST